MTAAVHGLASHLTVTDLGDSCMVQAVMVLHDHYCLWSSLARQDTVSLYRFAVSTLVPASQGPSMGKRLASATSSLRLSHCIEPQLLFAVSTLVCCEEGHNSLRLPPCCQSQLFLLCPLQLVVQKGTPIFTVCTVACCAEGYTKFSNPT